MFVLSLLALATLNRLCSAQDDTTCDFKWLTQHIDHLSQTAGTFQQRYSVYDEFYTPGGPILMFQGEEGDLDCAVSSLRQYCLE
jgi:hypothetical protein